MMKMISKTNMTSMSGVMLISEQDLPSLLPRAMAMVMLSYSPERRRRKSAPPICFILYPL